MLFQQETQLEYLRTEFPEATNLLVCRGTHSGRLVVLGTIHVWVIIEHTISLLLRPAPSLVHEMPVEASEWTMLCAFVLQKQRTLFYAKLFQVPIVGRAK